MSGAAFALGGPNLALEYVDMAPAEFESVHVRKTMFILIAAGRASEALSIVEHYGEQDYRNLAAKALVVAHAGRRIEASEILNEIPTDSPESWIQAWARDAAGDSEGKDQMDYGATPRQDSQMHSVCGREGLAGCRHCGR